MREAFLHFSPFDLIPSAGVLVKILGYQGIEHYPLGVADQQVRLPARY